MTKHYEERWEAAREPSRRYYGALLAESAARYGGRPDYFERQLNRAHNYAAQQIQLSPQALSDLDALGWLQPLPTTTADYVSAIRTWQRRLTDPEVTAGLPNGGQALLFAFGLGHTQRWQDARNGTLLKGSCHILVGEYTQAWDVLTASALDHPEICRYSDLSWDALTLLWPLTNGMRAARAHVQITRAFLIDKPDLADEHLAGVIDAARRHDHAFAEELQAACLEIPPESDSQRELRLGLGDASPLEVLIGLWDSQAEHINLRGPLPPCVIEAVVVPTSAMTDDHMLHANFRGGGTLECPVDLRLATVARQAMVPGVLLSVAIMLTADLGDEAGLNVSPLITRVGPYVAGGMAIVSSGEFSVTGDVRENEEVLCGQIEAAIAMAYVTPLTAFPPFLPPPVQASVWDRVDGTALIDANAALTSKYPFTLRPQPGRGYRARHFLDLIAFAGTLPPTAAMTTGWRGVAEVVWGSEPHRFPLADKLPGWLLPHLGASSDLSALMDAPDEIIAELCFAASHPNPDADHHGRWHPLQLARLYLEDGIDIMGLCAYRDVGLVDPAVAAAFARADVRPASVVQLYPSYLPALTTKYRWTPPARWDPTGRRAAPKDVPWSVIQELPHWAANGQALYEVLPNLQPEDGIA